MQFFIRKLRSYKFEIIICVFLFSIFYVHSISKLSLADSELEKCPACYGTNLCSSFESGDLQLTGVSSWRFFQFMNAKNVFNGFWVSRNVSVIIKKLGHDSELEDLDINLCKLADSKDGCYLKDAMRNIVEKLEVQTRSDKINISSLKLLLSRVQTSQDWLSCADQNLLDFILKKSLSHPAKPGLENILTFLLINQEPLMAMAFTPEMDYPFPRYFGACGRFAVFEDVGSGLDRLSSISPWSVRSALSLDLVRLATFLSNTSLNLALYPTDWAVENFSVDRETGGIVKLVDLENIVIVNLTRAPSPGDHRSDNFGCAAEGECFSFSIPSLCEHSSSDHNYYAVCANILSNSKFSSHLLRSPPETLVRKYRSFTGLLDICWRGGYRGRPDARRKAIRHLEKILEEQTKSDDEDIF